MIKATFLSEFRSDMVTTGLLRDGFLLDTLRLSPFFPSRISALELMDVRPSYFKLLIKEGQIQSVIPEDLLYGQGNSQGNSVLEVHSEGPTAEFEGHSIRPSLSMQHNDLEYGLMHEVGVWKPLDTKGALALLKRFDEIVQGCMASKPLSKDEFDNELAAILKRDMLMRLEIASDRGSDFAGDSLFQRLTGKWDADIMKRVRRITSSAHAAKSPGNQVTRRRGVKK